MTTYTAINIGPILGTIQMARKTRQLWAASYLFSYLMECIIESLPESAKIISPATEGHSKTGVGLYPDRVYIEGNVGKEIIEKARQKFINDTKLSSIADGYFRIMQCTTSEQKVNEAIKDLNHKLDTLELFDIAVESEVEEKVHEYIFRNDSPLFRLAFGHSYYKIEDLETIARSDRPKDSKEASFNKYICIVQADGDRMGESIMNAPEEKIKAISKALLNFGNQATRAIKEFSSSAVPVYAGGDDLLFIAPVVGDKGTNIFDLIRSIDNCYETVQKEAPLSSLSYGVSISYHKYPLYEAFQTAQHQLFDIAKKKVNGKNAIAWDLRKHSGGAFSGAFSKTDTAIYDTFKEIINVTRDGDTVTAVAHKIRANQDLIALWMNKDEAPERNENFFELYMDKIDSDYKEAAKQLLNALCQKKPKSAETLVRNMYGMLRTAKFVKGEPEHE